MGDIRRCLFKENQVLLGFLVLLLTLVGVAGITCQQASGNCKCETDEGTVDLAPVSAAGSAPVFNYIGANDGSSYDYDPCNIFTTPGGDCDGVLVCQRTSANTLWGIGDTSAITWKNDPNDNNNLMISYTQYGSDLVYRYSEVVLKCDPSADTALLDALGETGAASATFEFVLTSKYACPSGSGGGVGGGGGGGLSPGSILCIILVALLIVYVIGGMVFMRVGRGAQGAEMVPNSGFWKELPVLVMDGVKFSVGSLKRLVTGKSGAYDQV